MSTSGNVEVEGFSGPEVRSHGWRFCQKISEPTSAVDSLRAGEALGSY